MYQLSLARMRGWLMPGWFAHVLQRGVILAVLASQPSTLYPASLIVNFEGSEIRFGESSLPIGSSIFVVAPTGTENAFYTSLSQVSSAGAMASFLSNTSNLKFYNSEPVNYGTDNGGSPDEGTFRGWLEGDSTPGPAQISTAGNTASTRLFLLISTSANSSFDSTSSFLLLRQRASPNGSDLGLPIDSAETPFFANVSPDATTGMDVIFGEFFGTNTYRLSQAAGYGQITSDTTKPMNAGSTSTYQILSNNGANSFGVTSLPTWASLDSVTGVITLAPGASISGTFTLGLSAINSLTGKTATGSLAVTVVAPPAITSALTATATRGTAFTYEISADNSPTSFNAIGLPGGLSINTRTGVISGTPNVAAATFNVTVSATNTTGTGTATLVLTLSAAPVITSSLTATATRGTPFTTYQIAADSVPTFFNATGLPGGLSINTSTGQISGTPNVAAGTFNVTISARNVTGTGTATWVITLSAAPVISSTLTATATRGSAFSYQIAADSVPTSFNATGLPGGLSINTATGLISGTPNVAAGTFNVTVTARNVTGTGTATLVLTLRATPIISSTLTATATRGSAFSYQITADSSPASFNATGLPGGLSINTATGLISGTPNVTAGTFNVTISAINTTGTGLAILAISLSEPFAGAPVITSTLAATATRGTAFSYQIAANASPTSYNATGLPGGLSINTATGLISGTPNVAASTFNVTISAANTAGAGSTNLIITLNAAPVITSTLTATATRGTAFTYQIAADSSPSSYNATGLPGGLSISTSSGLISGTPNVAAGTFNVTISATNTTGAGTATLVITLSAAPLITSTLTATATRGSAFTYQIAAGDFPTSFNATGLPGGLSINTATGLISGTPNVAAGTFNVTVTARNVTGTGTATLVLTLRAAPVITSTLTAAATRGTAFTYQITADSSPTSFNATGLPGGLSISTTTGLISGTPNVAAGTFRVTVSAINATGTGTATLVLTLRAAPVITSTLTATATRGTAFTYQIAADSSPSSYNATGLPGGLSISTTTGLISGTPNVAAGTFNVTLSATNATGTGTATLVLDLTSPSLSIPSLVSNKLTRTAGTAYLIPVTIPAGFTVDSYTLEPAISGVTYSAGNILISSIAAPFAKGTTKETLTLTLNRTTGLNGATISASLTFDLRLEAPTPRLLTTRGPFEVTVGDDYSLQLLTDVSTLCPNQNFRIVGTLPPGLAISTGGLISGVNRSTSSPGTYETRFAADTTQYEGGGVFISPPVIFLLRNNPPVISSASRAYAGVLLKKFSYTLQTDTDNHVDSEILGVLPPGVVSRKSGLGSSTIILEGYPTVPGIYKNVLVAKNYLMPGNASTLQETSMELVTYVFGKDTSVKQELNSASLTTLVRGMAIDTNIPLRLTSGALSQGTYVVASSTSFRPISRPNDQRYEFLPGILLDPFTGIISGTPRTSGTFQVTVSFMNARKIEKTTVTLKVQ